MYAVVLVDGAPGFEEAIESRLLKLPQVVGMVEDKEGNYDIAVLVEATDADELQHMLDNELWLITGVRDLEVVKDPGKEILSELRQHPAS